jgi:hypothetical protein
LKRLEGREAGRGHKVWGSEGIMTEERWEKLDIWKLSDELALKVYIATKSFPKKELYGITSQIRRATLSIPTNTWPVN